ncbi:hypothetical protein [Paenibacillus tyrfis]|uniref:hypothetical protein n=1 Tax=Paenibacillus tyrfis TaxID=1501230 RepID=UPI00209D5905|nr:hypothetical protein [Paenibacillus tyrfis]MCP1307951.1 hypothetical protein [Paenibacillus tyrfis]
MGISKLVTKNPEFHVTPLEKIVIENTEVKIQLDDIDENRWEIQFSPYQAVNVTAIDCTFAHDYFNSDCYDRNGIFHRYLLEIEKSEWVDRLQNKQVDKSSDLLTKSKHYVLPLQDIVVEVLAWNITIVKL